MSDVLFDLGDLAVDLVGGLVSDLAVDTASDLSGILANGLAEGLAEVAGLHLTMIPRAWDLVADTLHENLGGDDGVRADA